MGRLEVELEDVGWRVRRRMPIPRKKKGDTDKEVEVYDERIHTVPYTYRDIA